MFMRLALTIVPLVLSVPAQAERLLFDHRLYPPLHQVLENGDDAMVAYDGSNPARLTDLIAVRGESAQRWSEALEIVSIVRPSGLAGVADWRALLERQAQARCPTRFTTIGEDARSVTFERRSDDCPTERAHYGIYRLVAGDRSWFMLAVLVKDDIDSAARNQWLALLASAHLD